LILVDIHEYLFFDIKQSAVDYGAPYSMHNMDNASSFCGEPLAPSTVLPYMTVNIELDIGKLYIYIYIYLDWHHCIFVFLF